MQQQSEANQSRVTNFAPGRIERDDFTKKRLRRNNTISYSLWNFDVVFRCLRVPDFRAIHFKEANFVFCRALDDVPAYLFRALRKIAGGLDKSKAACPQYFIFFLKGTIERGPRGRTTVLRNATNHDEERGHS